MSKLDQAFENINEKEKKSNSTANPQKFKWNKSRTFKTYDEASNHKASLDSDFVKIRYRRKKNHFDVMVGKPFTPKEESK